MADIRIINHEAVPKCGSYEVRYSDGRPSAYFYWEDLPCPAAGSGRIWPPAMWRWSRPRPLLAPSATS
jgi:hypothetical protein